MSLVFEIFHDECMQSYLYYQSDALKKAVNECKAQKESEYLRKCGEQDRKSKGC